jgi:ribose transport system substrate-binding protein
MHEDDAVERGLNRRLSRRESLRLGLIGAGSVALPGLLAACGSESTSVEPKPKALSSADLRPFDPNAPGGPAPGLPKRLAFPNPFDDPLSLNVSRIMRAAAEGKGLEYMTGISNGDPAKMANQLEGFFARGIGALFLTPVEEEATRPYAQRAIEQGAAVFGVFRPYCHLQVVEDQRAIGEAQGRAAVKWIKEHLNGKANVAYFNEDFSPSIIPRHKGVLAELRKGGPGIQVVSDVQAELTAEAGANAMNTIFQAHPEVNVAMGGSGVIAGVYSAFDARGLGNSPSVYISSIAGNDDALALIRSGRSSYRATFGEPWPIWAHAIGLFAADWLGGRSIPRVMSVPGGLVEISTPTAVDRWMADMRDPGRTWQEKRDQYAVLLGNISYASRNGYWRQGNPKLPARLIG